MEDKIISFPKNGYVQVELDEEKGIFKTGLTQPGETRIGTVVSVDSDWECKGYVKKGERIICTNLMQFTIEDKTLYFLKYDDIVAKL